LFVAFCVILATLVLQGLSLPALIRRLGVVDDGLASVEERTARLKANEAALAYLAEVDSLFPPEIVKRLRVEYDDRIRQLEVCASGSEDRDNRLITPSYQRLQQAALDVERRTIIQLRDEYVINGTKMWATNGEHSTVVATLVKTDPDARPPHRGMSCILAEKQYPGFTSSRRIEKLGYKGVETTELVFDNNRQPAANLLGEVEGQGFKQMMAAIEVGRVNVAARGVGVAQRAFELSIAYAQVRHAFGVPIAEHEAIQFKLADMATKIQAARLLTNFAARKKDAGERADVECGMAKLFASETCFEVVSEALRVHGGYGFSKEYDVERLYRDAPLLIIGEGTNEIQRLIIARGLLERHRITG